MSFDLRFCYGFSRSHSPGWPHTPHVTKDGLHLLFLPYLLMLGFQEWNLVCTVLGGDGARAPICCYLSKAQTQPPTEWKTSISPQRANETLQQGY